jgi:hypothetical protein
MNGTEGMVVYVIGANHGIQRQEPDVWDTPQSRGQSNHFGELVTEIVRKNKVQFIGEEWGLPSLTVAHALADDGNLPWVDINTTAEELETMNIPRDYVNGNYTNEQRERWHRLREEAFIQKLLEQKGDAQSLIVVCGFVHLQPLTQSLQKICKTVEPVDYRTMSWYDKNAFTD